MALNDVQSRLIILYTLRCYKLSMTIEDLQEIIVWQDIMDYFTMMTFVFDLEKMGMIKSMELEEKVRYDITDKGMESVKIFKDKIPLSIRDKIYDKTYEALEKIRRGREIVADILPLDERKYMAKCGIYEFGTPLIEVNLFAGDRKHAAEIAKRFEKEASKVYKIILENIIEE